MWSRRFSIRRAVFAGVVLAIVGGAFGGGRSTRPATGAPNPVRLADGIPVGGLETPCGALAAADNFVSTGVTASIEPRQLRQFVNTVVDPRARDSFIVDNPAPGTGPPPGARVTASVVAHRLVSYGVGNARVRMWVAAAYWGGGAVPTQYWSLVQLSLRWSDDRWRVVSGQDSLPGPIPGLIAGAAEDRAVEVWDQALAGMSAPYYGIAEDG